MILERWKAFRLQHRRRGEIADRFELKWLAKVVPLFVGASQFVTFIGSPGLTVALMLTTLLSGALVCAYLAHVLFARLQCSLLEFLALIFVLGNALGILLTTPCVYLLGTLWVATIVSFTVGWALYGAVMGLSHARLLSATSSRMRLTYMILAWFTSLSYGLLFTGLLIVFAKAALNLVARQRLLGEPFVRYGMPLVLIGILGSAIGIFVNFKVKRAARQILGEIPPQTRTPAASTPSA